jgi:hypothetical protein
MSDFILTENNIRNFLGESLPFFLIKYPNHTSKIEKKNARVRLFVSAFFEEKSKKSFHFNPFRRIFISSDKISVIQNLSPKK